MPKNINFISEITSDLMKLYNTPVLHLVDLRKNFASAYSLAREFVEDVWHFIIDCWSSICTEYPDIMRVYQRSIFKTTRVGTMTQSLGIHTKLSGVKSPRSLDAGEKYHGSLSP